ncbi:hypothetical protein ACHAWC_010624 [Mediolabrus comicus]
MGNVHSDISDDNKPPKAAVSAASASTTTAVVATTQDDYDPNGAVIPDVHILEIFNFDKLEGILNCVPLTIDPRSPTSRANDVEDNHGGGVGRKVNMKQKPNDKDEVDGLSAIAEGEDEDASSSAFNNVVQEETQQQQQQQQQEEEQQQTGNNTGDNNQELSTTGSDEEIEQIESTDSAECTEFDPDAMFATPAPSIAPTAITNNKEHQQPVLSDDDLDDVLMMRSEEDENDCHEHDVDHIGDLFQDVSEEEEKVSSIKHHNDLHQGRSTEPFDEPSEQHVIGLTTNPMDVAQRVCNAMSPTNNNRGGSYQFMNEFDISDHVDDDDDIDSFDEMDHKQSNQNEFNIHQEEAVNEEKEGSESDSNQFLHWTAETDSNIIMDWQGNSQHLTHSVDDANEIANKHFDEIISDFQLSPRQTYSNVRSWKAQRAHKQRRHKKLNNISPDAHADDKICKTIYSPQNSDAAFFAEETVVGRKLNGVPKVKVVVAAEPTLVPEQSVLDPEPEVTPSDEAEVNTGGDERVSYSADDTYDDERAERDEDFMDTDIAESHSAASSDHFFSADEIAEQPTEESDKGESVKSNDDVMDLINKIKHDIGSSSGESSEGSSRFEETNVRLQSLIAKASYDSDSVNDTVNWDNLDYSMSEASFQESGSKNISRQVSALRQSQEEDTHYRGQEGDVNGQTSEVAEITTEEVEERIKEMKKQRDDEIRSVKQSSDSSNYTMYMDVQRRIDAMREQHKLNIDNMRAALTKTEEHNRRRPSIEEKENKTSSAGDSPNPFNFDDSVIGKREKSMQELMKQNAELEEEMKRIRALSPRRSALSPRSTNSSEPLSPKSKFVYSFSHRYSPKTSYGSPASPSQSVENALSPKLSSMISEVSAEEENMNIRLNGMIQDIKSFLKENNNNEERMSEDILS